MTAAIWVGLFLVAWLWQNVAHEGAHLLVGWAVEGRRPLKLIPWPHFWQGRWYLARCEYGPAMKSGSAAWRHIAPLIEALVAAVVASQIMVYWTLCALPFLVAATVDALVWTWGMLMLRPGTDGQRWLEGDRIMKLMDFQGQEIETETLFCLHCDKEFPAADLIVDKDGVQNCPIADCDGCGVGWDLHEKRWWREQRDDEVDHD